MKKKPDGEGMYMEMRSGPKKGFLPAKGCVYDTRNK